jgi:hypothetical protein
MMNNVDMISVPHGVRALIRPIQEYLETLNEKLTAMGDGASVNYGAHEAFISSEMANLGQHTHKLSLEKLDIDSEFVKVWGSAYKRVGRYEAEYRSLEGPVRVTRPIYRKVGERNAPTVDAISLRTGVVADGWLPRAARAMGHLLAKGTSREAKTTSDELMRLPYSRTSFERVGHAVGTLYCAAQPRIEEALIEAYEVPAEAHSISVSIDRVSLAMEEEVEKAPPKRRDERAKMLDNFLKNAVPRHQLDPHTVAQLAEDKRHRKHCDKPKIERNWRMAYCATVTLHDNKGESMHTIRYGRMPAGDTRSLMRRLADDVRALRKARDDLRVVFLADGAPELWGLYDTYLGKQDIGVEAVRIVDCWHALEYLAAAARLMELRKKAWPGQFRRWKALLFKKTKATEDILVELKQSGLAEARDFDGNQPVANAIRYLEKRVPLTRYATARRDGLPIGSGNVEATCKSLVALRMKRSGARWKHTGGHEVMQLRALMLSDRWEQGIERALSTRRKPVKAIGYWEAKAA